MIKHTPGPWSVDKKRVIFCSNLDISYKAIDVGSEADARLIASSPEMLEILKQLEYNIDIPKRIYDSIKKVIAKAEGRDL